MSDNLIVPSSDEARKNGAKGGVASGKARRERKAMKETLESLLSMPLKNGKSADIETIKNLASLKGKNITVQEAIMLAQIQKAIKGDTKAAEYVRDTSGNKPKDDVVLNGSLQTETSKLDDLIKQMSADDG